MSKRFAKTSGRSGGKTIAALTHLGAVIAEHGGEGPLVISIDRNGWNALRNAIREDVLEWDKTLMNCIGAASDSAIKFTACGIEFLIRDNEVFEPPIRTDIAEAMNDLMTTGRSWLLEPSNPEVTAAFINHMKKPD